MTEHQHYMKMALELAFQGVGAVSPNPLVGAVLVYENVVIGKGYHQQYGEAHAEVNCVNSVSQQDKEKIPNSTLYVTLEPCSHFGKTPPCVDFILQHEIKKVVIACKDIFAAVNGSGINKLKENGVEVVLGVCEKEAIEMNKRFFTYHKYKRPFILLKWAESSDGFIGQNEKRVHLSNDATNKVVHKWRNEEDAIWVGYRTVLIDNPQLNVRHVAGKNPVRIVYDRNLEIGAFYHLLNNTQKTIIFNNIVNRNEGLLTFVKIEENQVEKTILECLYEKKILSVMIEGGARLLQKLIDANLWDEARVIKTKKEILKGVLAPNLPKHEIVNKQQIENDEIHFYKNQNFSL